MRLGPGLLLAGVLACSARGGSPQADRVVLVDVSAAELDPTTVRVVPASAVERVVVGDTWVSLSFGGAVPPFELRFDGACPIGVEPSRSKPGSTLNVTALPLFDAGPPARVVGYDRPFRIELAPRCVEAERAHVSWRQVGGPPLAELHVSADGRHLTGRTTPVPERYRQTVPWGVVPVSAAEQAEATLEASVAGTRFRTRVAAAHRSRGLANVAVGTRLLLGGHGWTVTEAPGEAGHVLTQAPPFTVFESPVSGRYRLEDAGGRALSLLAGRYDETPLDCGRAECHAATTRAALHSPMSSVLSRRLGALRKDAYPECALGCHTLGERSAADGGFAHLLRELALSSASVERLSWDELPRSLRRLGAVGCLGCHGPGTTPEPESRAALLASDVCATCHDAPPRYGHVAAWNSTRMARGAPDAAAAKDGCARCHTTAGFLQAQGVLRKPSPSAAGDGLDCVACHAPHEHGRADGGPAPALLRTVETAPELAGVALGRAAICVPCHTTRVGEASVPAASASIWAGRGGLRPRDGTPLHGDAAHLAVEGACLGCHRAAPSALLAGGGHAFAVDGSACVRCHVAPPSSDGRAALRTRAERLFARLTGAGLAPPPHARRQATSDTPLGRALHDVLLVLEDGAAFEHNAKYATLLLDAAAAALEEAR